METIYNWFFNLPIPDALGVVALVFVLLGTAAVFITDELVKLVVQRRIAGVDEFADRDDSFALLHSVSDRDDDYYRRVDMKSFTCTSCNQQSYCSFAFDLYNTDGDCLAEK